VAAMMIIGICGGTGSGKTTVAKKIISSVGAEKAACIQLDSYYRNRDNMPLDCRNHANFDHPDAFDSDLLFSHLEALRTGKPIDQPVYDFVTHSRRPDTIRIEPRPVIIVEGILVFLEARIRDLMDIKIFVDCPPDVRFIRRLERDIRERGRSIESVIEQYVSTVRPMHLQFVEPEKQWADVILPEGGFNEVGISLIINEIKNSMDFTGS
jgi:uridine kinase